MRQRWIGEDLCLIDNTKIRYVNSNFEQARTTADEMVVLKPESFFKQYDGIAADGAQRILELGIFEGGSVAILADRYPDAEIVAVDIRPPDPLVWRHIEALGFGERVKLYYGVSQSDPGVLNRVLSHAWGDAPIDLVIDDASHLYELSAASFDILFPRVRAGGFYCIEDWGWAHWPGYDGELLKSGRRALSSLILELTMAVASRPDVVAEMRVRSAMSFVKRGPAAALPLRQLLNFNGEGRVWRGI